MYRDLLNAIVDIIVRTNHMKTSAKTTYIENFKNHQSYDEKYKRGKNKIDQNIEAYLLEQTSKLFDSNAKILELGVFTGRVNTLIRKHWNEIFVTDVNEEMIARYENSFILDLSSACNDVSKFTNRFDLCVSLGHQVSFSCNIDNSFKLVNNLLKENAYFLLDIWNSNCHEKFDPSYELQKSNACEIIRRAKLNGFKLESFSMGQKLFYLFPRLFIILEKLLGNIFTENIVKIEKRMLSVKRDIPVQNLYFLFQKVKNV